MAAIKIHYDGWISLPENFRRRLGLQTGDKVEAVLTEGGILLQRNDSLTDEIDDDFIEDEENYNETIQEIIETPISVKPESNSTKPSKILKKTRARPSMNKVSAEPATGIAEKPKKPITSARPKRVSTRRANSAATNDKSDGVISEKPASRRRATVAKALPSNLQVRGRRKAQANS